MRGKGVRKKEKYQENWKESFSTQRIFHLHHFCIASTHMLISNYKKATVELHGIFAVKNMSRNLQADILESQTWRAICLKGKEDSLMCDFGERHLGIYETSEFSTWNTSSRSTLENLIQEMSPMKDYIDEFTYV